MSIDATNRQAHTKVLEDLWRNTISAVHSEIGKLAYLASLRDPNSGLYHHYGLETVYSPEQCDRALRQTHLSLFYEWLKKPLAEQKEDVEVYFRTIEGQLDTILENWAVLEPYRAFVPVEADEAGRQLFTSDLRLLVEVMRRELWAGPRRPTA
jgi:hypothetical protein